MQLRSSVQSNLTQNIIFHTCGKHQTILMGQKMETGFHYSEDRHDKLLPCILMISLECIRRIYIQAISKIEYIIFETYLTQPERLKGLKDTNDNPNIFTKRWESSNHKEMHYLYLLIQHEMA